jgi:hypothetical protein
VCRVRACGSCLRQVDKLNAIINGVEKEMLRLKKQYELVVEARNYTGAAMAMPLRQLRTSCVPRCQQRVYVGYCHILGDAGRRHYAC